MSRTRGDARFDFRGGVNTAFGADVLASNELRVATNARLNKFGAIVKRNGTQRVHGTAIASGADVLGGTQWDTDSVTGEIVAIAGGNLYHKALGDSNFTTESSSLSTTNLPWFAVHVVSGSRTLYIADGSLRSWDGSSLTTSISGAPDALTLAVYKRRLFATDGTKTIYWSKVADPTTWSSALGGGSAPIETYDAEPVVGMATVGDALLLFKEDSVARYTGVIESQINIGLNTEGVAPDVGCIAPKTICRFEQYVFFLSDRGPFAANDFHAVPIGAKIEDNFDGRDWTDAVAVHHKGAREIWMWSHGLQEGWIYNYRLEAWTGPHDLSSTFDVYSAWPFEKSDGSEGIMFGGGDGFVRDGDNADNGSKDDVHSDDTSGTAITMSLTFPTLLFGDPGTVKLLPETQYITANLKTNGSLAVSFQGDGLTAQSQTLASAGAGVNEYQTRPGTHGRRIVLTMEDATSEPIEIHGASLAAQMGRRAA